MFAKIRKFGEVVKNDQYFKKMTGTSEIRKKNNNNEKNIIT